MQTANTLGFIINKYNRNVTISSQSSVSDCIVDNQSNKALRRSISVWCDTQYDKAGIMEEIRDVCTHAQIN